MPDIPEKYKSNVLKGLFIKPPKSVDPLSDLDKEIIDQNYALFRGNLISLTEFFITLRVLLCIEVLNYDYHNNTIKYQVVIVNPDYDPNDTENHECGCTYSPISTYIIPEE